MRLTRAIRGIRTSLWFVPVMCVLAGGVVSFVSIAIDRANDYRLVPSSISGGPDSALAILSTVAISMVTLTVLVLTVTMVVVQLAMGQFSPRIVQTFLQDKPSQFAIGLFVATFAHSMLAMREVHFEEPVTVPGLAIVVAYGLVVVSIAVLVLYVHHIGQSLRVSSLLELVGQRTRRLMDELHPDQGLVCEDGGTSVVAHRAGVVNQLDDERIVALAARRDCRIELVPRIGEFVPSGGRLFELSTPIAEEVGHELRGAVLLGLERTLDRDMAYGFRMLVDMAERSIAEDPLLDPTTAVQAIDRLHDCLRQLVRRPFPSGEHRDDAGVVRLEIHTMGWDEYVHLAFDELILASPGSPTVVRRLRQALDDLSSVATEDRCGALEEVRRALDAASRPHEIVLLDDRSRRGAPQDAATGSRVSSSRGT
jgi:uncharacterized membrane protein